MRKLDISVVILNYNTKEILLECIRSIVRKTRKVNYEIVVVDNGSTDGSVEAVKELEIQKPKIKIIRNKRNLGFARGNNRARNHVSGKYVLFLNSDTKFTENSLKKVAEYIKEHGDIGALTVKQVLPDGKLDPDMRRSFPTPWVSLTHFSRLDRLFPKSKLFARYRYGYLKIDRTCEIEVLQGSFFFSPKEVLDRVGWFDEDYYLNGEDIDLSWKIKEAGYKNVYFAGTKIIHLKGATKGKKISKIKRPLVSRLRYALAGVRAMEIFYRKRLWGRYPFYINWLVIVAIQLMKVVRIGREIVR